MYMCVRHWGVMVLMSGVCQGVWVNALNQLQSMWCLIYTAFDDLSRFYGNKSKAKSESGFKFK